jgi:hypothetical protein
LQSKNLEVYPIGAHITVGDKGVDPRFQRPAGRHFDFSSILER